MNEELLSAVLDTNVAEVSNIISNYNSEMSYLYSDLSYYDDDQLIDGFINIYELQHKIKEWAVLQRREIFSRIILNDGVMLGNCLIQYADSDNDEILNIFNAPTEFDAVVKAAEWIISNMEETSENKI